MNQSKLLPLGCRAEAGCAFPRRELVPLKWGKDQPHHTRTPSTHTDIPIAEEFALSFRLEVFQTQGI